MRVPVFIAAALTACLAVCAPGTSRGAQLFTTLDFQFEDGSVLPDVHIAYETHGTLSPARDNAILLIPGAIGDRHVFDWAIGSGKIFDTDKYFVIAVDPIGGGESSSPAEGGTGSRAKASRAAVSEYSDSSRAHSGHSGP